jgi:hypothetical protein
MESRCFSLFVLKVALSAINLTKPAIVYAVEIIILKTLNIHSPLRTVPHLGQMRPCAS